jgi:hypothetical protein
MRGIVASVALVVDPRLHGPNLTWPACPASLGWELLGWELLGWELLGWDCWTGTAGPDCRTGTAGLGPRDRDRWTGVPSRIVSPASLAYDVSVVLYVCPSGTSFGSLPAPLGHPCGRAAKALQDAGHSYETKTVNGGVLKFWTLPNRARDRAEVEHLSGQRAVPILVLDDGSVVAGSGSIAEWAKANPSGS